MTLAFAPERIKHWPLARLKPYTRNAKQHKPDQVAKLAASMAEFGWTVPCLAGVPGYLSVWTGSPPCQPFSQAGQRKGQDDDRHLDPAFLQLVGACRPGLVFGEQVASAAVLGRVGTASRKPTAWC